MKTRSVVHSLAFLLASILPSFAHHTAVVVNKENSVENLTSVQLSKIVRGETRQWSNGKAILLVLHKDSAGEAETLQHLNKMTPQEWRAFVAVHHDLILLVDTDADVLKAVESEPEAVGMVDVRSVDGSINIVRVDGKLPMEGGYLPH